MLLDKLKKIGLYVKRNLMRTLWVVLFSLTTMLALRAQIVRLDGNIIDGETNEPVPYVEVYDQNNTLLSFGNEEGDISVMLEFSDTVVYLDHPLYRRTKVNTRYLVGVPVPLMPLPIQIEWVEDMIESDSLIYLISNSLEKNYIHSDHILTGYYVEKTRDKQGIFHNYGEGVNRTLKKPYRNMPDLDWAFKTDGDEFIELESGFYKDFRINLGSDEQEFYFPALNTAMLLPKTHDFLKVSISPIMEENVKRYDFTIKSLILHRNKPCYLVEIEPKDTFRRIKGSIIVDWETHAVVQADYKILKDQRTQKTSGLSSIELTGENVHIRYIPYEDKWVPGLIMHKSEYRYNPTMDSLTMVRLYATTSIDKDNLDAMDKAKAVASRTRTESVIPAESNVYFFGKSTVPRTRDVRDLVENVELIIDPGNVRPIVFYNDKYSKILDFAVAQRKHILIDFFAEWSEANVEMDLTTYMQQNVIRAVNKDFIAYKVDVEKEKRHPVLRELYVDVVPAFVLVTPLGQIISTKTGYMFEDSFLEFLQEAARIDAGAIIDAYDFERGSRNRKMAAADKELFKQMMEFEKEGALYYLERYLTETNDWGDPIIKDYIFENLMLDPESFYSSLLGEEKEYFMERFGKERYMNKLNELAILYFQGNMNDPRRYERYVKTQDRENADSLSQLFFIEYYGRVNRDDRRYVDAVISYYSEFDHQNWDEAKSRILTAIVFTDHNSRLRDLLDLLEMFNESAKDYEKMDLESVIHYKLGDQQKAMLMIEDIRKLALKEGINYQVALKRLVSE